MADSLKPLMTKNDEEVPTAGYCALCREIELELYDELVDDERHIFACKEAGCLHPAFYY